MLFQIQSDILGLFKVEKIPFGLRQVTQNYTTRGNAEIIIENWSLLKKIPAWKSLNNSDFGEGWRVIKNNNCKIILQKKVVSGQERRNKEENYNAQKNNCFKYSKVSRFLSKLNLQQGSVTE